MRNKRIFITGGTGNFGKSILRHYSGFNENDFVLLSPDPDKLKKEFPSIIYGEDFFAIYGLYSRHGMYYPPYNFIPDINYSEFLDNFI